MTASNGKHIGATELLLRITLPILTAGMLGLCVFAFDINAEVAVIKTTIEHDRKDLKGDIIEIKETIKEIREKVDDK